MSLLGVYTIMVFMIGSVIFFANSIRREAEKTLSEAPELIVQRVVAGRHALMPTSYAGTIEAIRGARAVTPRLWGYYFHLASESNYTLMVSNDFHFKTDEIGIGEGVYRTWGTIEENQLFFKDQNGDAIPLKIADVFSKSSAIWTSDLIVMSEPMFRTISGVPEGFATDLTVKVRNSRECQTIAEKITQILPDTRPILREEIQRTYSSIFDWRSGYVIVLLTGALLAFFIFAWDKATGLSSEEKKEIGILKGIGWDTADILLIKFWEGAVISLSAYLLGVILAYVHVFFASAPLFEHALKGWAILYPSFKLYPVINPFTLSVLFFLTVVPYTLISIIPTWRAAITDPDMVMRN